MSTIAEWLERIALGLERGERNPAAVAAELRDIAERVRALESAALARLSRQAPYIPGPEADDG